MAFQQIINLFFPLKTKIMLSDSQYRYGIVYTKEVGILFFLYVHTSSLYFHKLEFTFEAISDCIPFGT